MLRTRLRGLYAITPDCNDGRRLLADVEAALAGGCRIVQYRDKISNKPEQLARAKGLALPASPSGRLSDIAA